MTRRRHTTDDISIVEQAYRLGGTLPHWLDAMADAITPRADMGFGARVEVFSHHSGRLWPMARASRLVPATLDTAIDGLVQSLPPSLLAQRYGPTAREFVGWHTSFWPGSQRLVTEAMCRSGHATVRALFGTLVFAVPGVSGLALVAPARRADARASRLRTRWLRVMTHVAAGLRLRQRLAASSSPPEGVLTPEGRLLHAASMAQRARPALEQAIKDIERARGRLRKTAPHEALRLWQGLVAGRWSIVDWVDTDGRRYLLAHANGVSSRDPRALTGRELDIAEYLTQGRSTAEIAYALGLAEGTVNRGIRDVLRKLGGTRRDIASLFGGVAPLQASVAWAANMTVLTPDADAQLWSRLSEAERDVLARVLAGQPVSQVARARGVSAKTINNQLGAVYARLGVRGQAEAASLLGRAPPPAAQASVSDATPEAPQQTRPRARGRRAHAGPP